MFCKDSDSGIMSVGKTQCSEFTVTQGWLRCEGDGPRIQKVKGVITTKNRYVPCGPTYISSTPQDFVPVVVNAYGAIRNGRKIKGSVLMYGTSYFRAYNGWVHLWYGNISIK